MPIISLIITRRVNSITCVPARGGPAAGRYLRPSDQRGNVCVMCMRVYLYLSIRWYIRMHTLHIYNSTAYIVYSLLTIV